MSKRVNGPVVNEILEQLVSTRLQRGVTQTEMAIRIGITRAALSFLESGRFGPRASTLERYAAALGMAIRLTPLESAP